MEAALLERLDELFRYDEKTGILYWKKRTKEWFRGTGTYPAARRMKRWNTRYAGKPILKKTTHGYVQCPITFKGKIRSYQVHRLIWALKHGRWPEQIDHLNGVRCDNRLENLREVTAMENNRNRRLQKNNTSGVMGVSWQKAHAKWLASISVNNKKIRLGCFDLFHEAVAARKAAEIKYGFHENHGKPPTPKGE